MKMIRCHIPQYWNCTIPYPFYSGQDDSPTAALLYVASARTQLLIPMTQ